MTDPLPLDQKYPPLMVSLIKPKLKPCSDPDLQADIAREEAYDRYVAQGERERDGR